MENYYFLFRRFADDRTSSTFTDCTEFWTYQELIKFLVDRIEMEMASPFVIHKVVSRPPGAKPGLADTEVDLTTVLADVATQYTNKMDARLQRGLRLMKGQPS